MILKDSIISAFTERGTLLKWLKKVEAALKSDVLTDISVDQVSETQIKLKFTFANGDYVESPVLTLPRGNTGETGATGATGAAGADGVGFDNASNIEQNSGLMSLTTVITGLKVGANFKITAGGEVFEIPSTMRIPIKGSGSIVIDVDESGNYFNINLDPNIVSKINSALVKPEIAPSSTSIVAVNSSKSQTMLSIGYGLTLQGNTLKAAITANPTAEATEELSKLQVGNTVYSIPSGGGGGGGTQLYMHNFYAYETDFNIYFSIYSSNSNTLDFSEFCRLFIGNAYMEVTKSIYISGVIFFVNDNKFCNIYEIDISRSVSPIVDNITIKYFDENGEQQMMFGDSELHLIDTVTPL